jgi:hypothetical protein
MKKTFSLKNICNGYKIFVTVTKIMFCNERLPTPKDGIGTAHLEYISKNPYRKSQQIRASIAMEEL